MRIPTTVILVLLLAGCQASVAASGPARFALGPVDPAVGGQADSGPATASNLAPASRPLGQLTITFTVPVDARKRQLLATLADVDKVEIRVRDSAGAEHAQTVLKNAIQDGIATATFTGLPLGLAGVELIAKDANGKTIGYVKRNATVTAGGAGHLARQLHTVTELSGPRAP